MSLDPGASSLHPPMSACRPLPPVAARVDAELARMDGEVDWLLALSPIGNDALWDSFEASGHTE
ncbi:MAG: hypothetical protein ACREO4_00480, partial [Lysobacter sp.]